MERRAFRSVCRRWTPAGVWAVAVMATVAGAPVSAQERRCPDGDDRVVRVDIAVDVDAGRITVQPDSVEVFLEPEAEQPNRVCWVLSGMPDGHRLRFESKPGGDPGLFPKLHRVITRPDGFANSGRPARAGTWVYALRVENLDGKTVAEVDPQVIVRAPTSAAGGSGDGSQE